MSNDFPATIGEVMKYTGFWQRLGASLIDTVIILVLTYPFLISIYGWRYFDDESLVVGFADLLLSWLFPLVAIIAFWVYRQATPGKIAIQARIVDAKTGKKPTLQQYIVRYIGYFLASIPFGVGIVWVAWDKKKQGWHDKLAGTVVISPKSGQKQEVKLEDK